jgi:hypothetical protein
MSPAWISPPCPGPISFTLSIEHSASAKRHSARAELNVSLFSYANTHKNFRARVESLTNALAWQLTKGESKVQSKAPQKKPKLIDCMTMLKHFLEKSGHHAYVFDYEREHGRNPDHLKHNRKFIEQGDSPYGKGDSPYDWVINLGKYQMLVSEHSAEAAEYRKAKVEEHQRQFGCPCCGAEQQYWEAEEAESQLEEQQQPELQPQQ